ncbi:MAG TPA: hypothetical protein VL330_15630, partial [Actinomycetes bacterium]|nr:hypothetical protein [Actinomycetes bacterium]
MSRRPGRARGGALGRGPGGPVPVAASAPTPGAPPEVERGSRDRRAGRRARAWLWPLVRPYRGLVVL